MTTTIDAVEDLSPALRAQIRAFDQQWIDLLTGTARADRAAVEAALSRIYLHRGLAPPAHVVWVDSPVAVGYLTELILTDGRAEAVRNRLSGKQREAFRSLLDAQVASGFWDTSRRTGGYMPLPAAHSGESWMGVLGLDLHEWRPSSFVFDGGGAKSALARFRRYSAGGQSRYFDEWVDALMWRAPAGTVEWLADQYVERWLGSRSRPRWWPSPVSGLSHPRWRGEWFRLSVSGDIEEARLYRDLSTVYRHASYVQFLPDVVVLSENPITIRLDREGRCHNETGPALTFADGFVQYCWHGRPVPAEAILEPVDLGMIVRERNAEVRRCLIERMGWDTLVRVGHLEPVSPEVDDPGNPPHTLRLYEIPERLQQRKSRPARLLLCTNGTAEADGSFRRYGLLVHGRHTDPVAAVAELYGVSANTYRRMQART